MVTDAGQAGQPSAGATDPHCKGQPGWAGPGWERLELWVWAADCPGLTVTSPACHSPAHTHLRKLELAKIPKILENKDMSWIKSEVKSYGSSKRACLCLSDSIVVQEQEQDVIDFWNIGNNAHSKTGSWSEHWKSRRNISFHFQCEEFVSYSI